MASSSLTKGAPSNKVEQIRVVHFSFFDDTCQKFAQINKLWSKHDDDDDGLCSLPETKTLIWKKYF